MTGRKCGFAGVIGLPNAGKSTLVNALVGSKVSIVSRKVQTTRCRILGIALHRDAQIVLMDTPGLFTPKKMLEKAMVKAALQVMAEADAVLHLVDVSQKEALRKNTEILKQLPQDKHCLLILNKIDKVRKQDLLAITQAFNDSFSYQATYMVSALKEQGLKDLLEALAVLVPEAPWMFEEDQITDMPLRFMAAEITREKLFDRLHQELPYSIFVETENWENRPDGSVKIDQIVYVQKDTQKGIVLGKSGNTIKRIGQAAREEMEEFLNGRVHLKLFVKVQENWSERQENFRLLGLHSKE